MHSLLNAACLALLTGTFATPVKRQATMFNLPASYAALGDSFAAGIGSGKFLSSSADGSDNACARMDGSYPWKTFQSQPFEPKISTFSDFIACSGDVLDDIDGQVKKLGGRKVDLVTMSISGNDFHFGDVVRKCVYPWGIIRTGAWGKCQEALNAAQTAINSQENWDKYINKVNLIRGGVLSTRGQLIITGYAKFFAAPHAGDICDNIFFLDVPLVGRVLKMGSATRGLMNDMVDQVNHRIREDVVGTTGPEVFFVDIDKHFEGHRFCEPEALTRDQAVGSNDNNVWFNDIMTKLEETGTYNPADSNQKARAWDEWDANVDIPPEFVHRGINDKLQKNSCFHPKSFAHQLTATDVIFTILHNAPPSEVTFGPNKHCMGFGHGGGLMCFDIPENCAIVNPIDNVVPTAICRDGQERQLQASQN